jgi:hypothetical protein
MPLWGVGEAQEQAVGQHRATQASPRHTAPPSPLRDWRGSPNKPTPEGGSSVESNRDQRNRNERNDDANSLPSRHSFLEHDTCQQYSYCWIK